MERKFDTVCSVVTRQCMPSYGAPHHQQHSATELGSSRPPCLQPRPGPFRFPFVLPLKNAQRSRRFASDDEVQEAVHDWLLSQPQTFFSSGIKKLADRWAKCIEKKGDYIEK